MHASPRRTKKRGTFLATLLGFGTTRDTMRAGFALMTTTIMLGLLLAFTALLLSSAFNTRKVGNVFEQELSSEQLAEAGLHKALYCLKATSGTNCGGTYGASYTGESNVSLGGGKFTTTVTGNSTTKTITTIGTSPTGQTKTVKSDITSLPPTTSLIMSAAVQAGAGGVTMTNNVVVTGDGTLADSDIQSVGDIVCTNNAQAKGNVSVTRVGGKIDGCTITKNAYADILTNDTITMDAHYKTDPSGIAGSTVHGTKYPNSTTPGVTPFPNLDIASWETIASAGTVHNGNYTLSGSATDTIGPEKIIGNFSLSNNAVLTLTGPIYITGTISISNNAIVQLSPSYGAASGIVIADGTITTSNNGNFVGSGTSGSVIVLVSNSTNNTDGSPAIDVSNNVTGAVFYAPNGEISASNNASIPAAIGLTVKMTNNTTINSSGLNVFAAPINIVQDLSSSGWHIGTNTWREYK